MNLEQQALFPNQESSPEDSLVRTYQWLENELGLKGIEVVSSGKSAAYLTISNPNGSSLKMSPVCFPQTEDETWEPSSKRWLTGGMGSHTEFLTLSSSESPSVAVESSLSAVLETQGEHLRKYLLSPKACEGILRRASRRGKTLPKELEAALRSQLSDQVEQVESLAAEASI